MRVSNHIIPVYYTILYYTILYYTTYYHTYYNVHTFSYPGAHFSYPLWRPAMPASRRLRAARLSRGPHIYIYIYIYTFIVAAVSQTRCVDFLCTIQINSEKWRESFRQSLFMIGVRFVCTAVATQKTTPHKLSQKPSQKCPQYPVTSSWSSFWFKKNPRRIVSSFVARIVSWIVQTALG